MMVDLAVTPEDPMVERSRPPETNRASGPFLAAAGILLPIAYALLRGFDAQLARLQDPGQPDKSYGYGALHTAEVGEAFDLWTAARTALAVFDPVHPAVLIRIHVAVDALVVALVAGLSWTVLRRIGRAGITSVVVVLYVVLEIAEAGIDLALAAHHTGDPARYATVAPWLGRAQFACLLIIALVVGGNQLRAGLAGRAWRAYRGSPATARIALALACAFAALPHASDIGAQMEDLLRREIEELVWGRLLLILGALGGYLLVVSIIRQIEVGPGAPPAARTTLIWGVVIVGVAGLVRVTTSFFDHVAPTSGLLVLGLIVFTIGATSRGTPPPAQGPEADGHWLYAVAAVLPVASMAVLAGRLTASEGAVHGPWVRTAVLTALLAAGTVLVGVMFGQRSWRPWPPVEITSTAPPSTALQARLRALASRLAQGGLPAAVLLLTAATAPAVGLIGLVAPTITDHVGRWFGGIGVVLVVMAASLGLAGTLRIAWGRTDAPSVFRRLGLERTPVVTLLVIWMLLTSTLDAQLGEHVSHHRVRMLEYETAGAPVPGSACDGELEVLLDTADGTAPYLDVAEQFCTWIAQQATTGTNPAVGSDTAVPLVLVTASGGGVRAATWTARVFDCLFVPGIGAGTPSPDPCGTSRTASEGRPLWRYVFAAGGASGGSVGLTSGVAQVIATGEVTEPGSGWVRDLATRDHVGPVLARFLLGEASIAPIGLATVPDRAGALTDGWAARFDPVDGTRCPDLDGRPIDQVGFRELAATCGREVPLLLFNGTVVATGQRFNISPLDGSETRRESEGARAGQSWATGSVDLVDVLCEGDDLPLFDAAFLSARFPYVTPSGWLPGEDAGVECGRDITSGVDVVDGGYLENSGTAQVGELWRALEPLVESYNGAVDDGRLPPGHRAVVPVLVEIDNGEDSRLVPGGVKPEAAGVPDAPTEDTSDDADAGASDADLRSTAGEPARPPLAWLRVLRAGSQSKTARRELCEAIVAGGGHHVLMKLYTHPGNPLPLGWALSDSVVDDIDAMFGLEQNREAATRFLEIVDDRVDRSSATRRAEASCA